MKLKLETVESLKTKLKEVDDRIKAKEQKEAEAEHLKNTILDLKTGHQTVLVTLETVVAKSNKILDFLRKKIDVDVSLDIQSDLEEIERKLADTLQQDRNIYLRKMKYVSYTVGGLFACQFATLALVAWLVVR